jgi:broad specificity phosphatase PhoE
MPVHLILIRHGQPDVPKTGHTGNPPLSLRGHEQARCAADVLRHEHIDRIVTSAMVRAVTTAQPLIEYLGIPMVAHPDLGEVDRYGGDYASIEAIKEKGRDEWRKFLASPLSYFGVDADQFRSETLAAFRAVMDEGDDQTIAIFTHGFPINILLSHALGLKDDARFVPSYASITRLYGRSFDALTVVSVNETGHIPKELR